MAENKLHCRYCKTEFTAEQVFDTAEVCWPNKHWLSFDCPTCGKEAKTEIEKSQVSIGDIDAAPGPCFMPDSTIHLHGLSTEWLFWGAKINYAGRVWKIRAKR